MFKQTFIAATLVSASFAFAAPQATWIPESSDLVMTGLNLQNDNKVADEAWRAALKTMGIDIELMEKEAIATLDSDSPELKAIYEAFEYNPETKKHVAESITAAMTLPPAKDFEQLSAVITIETTKALNVDKIATALNAAIKDETDATFVKDGTWYTLTNEDGSAAFSAYKNGLRFIVAVKDPKAFETLKSDTFKGIDASSPLNQALKAPNEYASMKVALKDLSGLVKRIDAISEKDRQQMMQSAPMLFVTKDVCWTLSSEGKNYVIEAVGSHAKAQDATMVAQAITSYRFLATMIVAAEFSPDSALMKAINGINIASKDKTASIKIVLNPDEALAIFQEVSSYIAKQEQMYGPSVEMDSDDVKIEFDFDEEEFGEEEELSEEEARAILEEMMKQQQ